jgi:hypothetical protein
MAKNIERLAEKLGAQVVGELPEVGGGAFGAARLGAILRETLEPSPGKRPGRPTNLAAPPPRGREPRTNYRKRGS